MLRNSKMAATQQQPQVMYSFPELKNQDVLECLGDLGIPLSEAELIRPTMLTVQRVYEVFVEMFMGMGPSAMAARNGAGVLEMLEYPELHAESIGLVGAYRTVARLMARVGIDDFSLRDLIRPEGPRFRLVLSAVINFAKFREEQLGVYEQFNRRSDELIETRERLQARQEELQEALTRIKQERIGQEPRVVELRDQIGGLIQELRELKREQTGLSTEIEGLKGRRVELADRLAQTQLLLSSIRQECTKLKSRIVHSPEKLLQIIAEMNASITAERTNLTGMEKRSRELQAKLEALGTLETDLQKTQGLLEMAEQALRKRQETLQRLQEEQDRVDCQQTALNDLLIREQQLQRQLVAAQDKLSRLQSAQEQRRQSLSARLTSLQAEYGVVAEERAKAAAEIDQAERTIKELEMRSADLVRSHEAELWALQTDCLVLKNQVMGYCGEVKRQLEAR